MEKKGQLSLGSAPMVVLIVGLTFLVMATVAFIGQKYGAAMPSDTLATVYNDTPGGKLNETGILLNYNLYNVCNYETVSITSVYNNTGGKPLTAFNYSITTAGLLKYNVGVSDAVNWNNSRVNVSYTYYWGGVSCDINDDLQTNISDNTSIAGIILTISLVGIVLTVLIGVFLGLKTPRV